MITPAPFQTMRLLVLRLLVLAAGVLAVFLLAASVGSADEPPSPTVQYIVEPGDTLWEIAAAVAPDGADIRDTVHEITSINGLQGALIHPGQQIELPAG